MWLCLVVLHSGCLSAGAVESSPVKPEITYPALDQNAERIVSAAIDKSLNSSAQGPNVVNVNAPTVSPAINMQVSPHMTFSLDFKNYSINTIFQYTSKIKSMMTNTVNGFHEIYTWLAEHKKTVCLVSVCAICCAIQWRIYRLERLLQYRKNWSLNTACMLGTPYEDICDHQVDHCCYIEVDIDRLIVAIQRRYIDKDNVFDCVKPLAVFMNAVDRELVILKQYRDLIKKVRKARLSKLFWYSAELYESVPFRSARLVAIKSSFVTWLADCKQEALHTVLKRKQRMDFGIQFILRS